MTAEGQSSERFSSHDLKRAVRSGTRAVAVAQVASQLVSLATLAVLFRILEPSHYGLMGMVVPLLLFLRIFTALGLNVATVQRRELSPGEVSTLFWWNTGAGVLTAVFTVLAAPGVAWFYDQPQLIALTIVLAGTSLVAALGQQHQALLERNLRLGRLAGCRLMGQLCGSAAAILAALFGWDVWALVVQMYAELVALALAAWIAEPWRPMRIGRGRPVAPHLRLGRFFSASSVMLALATTVDKVLVGRWLGPHALGLYSQAFNVMIKPVYLLTTPLTGIMLTALSRAWQSQQSRAELLAAFYRLTGVVLLPVSVGLALVGRDVMLLLGGADWTGAGPILSVLSLAIFGQGLIIITWPIFSAAGRTDRLFFSSVVVTLVLVAAYVLGWRLGQGLENPALAIAWSYSLAVLVVLSVPYTLYCLRTTGHRVRPILAAIGRPALAAVMMGAGVWLFQRMLAGTEELAVPMRLVLEIAVGVAIYAAVARREIRWLLGQMLGKP